jgi:transcriptional regulator with XRE-family HTH domain
MQRAQLIAVLKRALRSRGITYADVAKRLGLSESSVKRLFRRNDLSLSRLETLCEIVGLTLADLIEAASAQQQVSALTKDQERELIESPKLLLMSYLLINRWQLEEITRRFSIEPDEASGLLRKLKALRLIEILPFGRIKVLTARNFSWRRDGPVQRYFLEQVQRDFFDAKFDGDGDVLYLLGGLLSPESRSAIAQAMHRLAAEIDDLARQDARLPRERLAAFGSVVALRPWEFSAFTALRR